MKGITIFAQMGEIDPRFVAEAEELLLPMADAAAVSGKRRSRQNRRTHRREQRENGFARFMNSGWAAAAISTVVALGVLIAIVRAGQTGTGYEPPKQPSGSTIQMSDTGVNYTVATDQTLYPVGTQRITAILRGKEAGESIRPNNAWYLEKVTEDGAEAVGISFTEDAWDEIQPTKANGGYAQTRKGINTAPLTAGTYRLHNTVHDGEMYVSVAYCEFTVGDIASSEDTTAADGEETAAMGREEMHFPPAEETVPYTVTTSPSIPYGSTGIGITYRATEQGAVLYNPYLNWRIVKLDGEPNGEEAACMSTDIAIAEVHPTEQNGGYAQFTESILLVNPEAWLPGTYRLYTLNYHNEYVAYCDFVIAEPTAEDNTESTPS